MSRHYLIRPAEDGETRFVLNEDHSGKSGIGAETGSDQTREASVQTIKLDTFAQEQNLNRLDFLKIDVEGHEAEVLAGAETVI